ncbi:MAG: ORF6N domain-containing protein [Bacteroidaceae bacterium]|nr:ORF6N domain-containing protein [Bacteroidaceae bacterium]
MDELINIQDFIHVIRGQRVMLDRDIAAFYGVETKRLNEKVKRNPKRFAGEDFMFQLTQEEFDEVRLRSQFATIKKGRGSHSKYLPHAFTLLGISMLSSVLESDSAIEANRRIMRAFVTFHQIKSLPPAEAYDELKKEIANLRQEMDEILADQNDINESTRAQLDAISTALVELQASRSQNATLKTRRPIGFIQPKEDEE